jgi:uncharacterized protein YbaP (TraB family)
MIDRRTLLAAPAFAWAQWISACGESTTDVKGVYWVAMQGNKSIWLVPTLHKAPAPIGLPQRLARAVAAAEALAVELDPTDSETAAVAANCDRVAALVLPGVDVDVATSAKLDRLLEAAKAPASAKGLHPYVKATIAAVHVTRDWSLANGLDLKMIREARAHGKPVVPLESACEWFDAVATAAKQMSSREFGVMIQETLLDISSGWSTEFFSTYTTAWGTGDFEALARLFAVWRQRLPVTSQFQLAQYGMRNEAMLRRIAVRPAARSPLIVAIGLLHMVGPNGLPDLLRQRGWTIERGSEVQ